MGVVYEAYDEERGARVALKTIRSATPASLARFKREFRALADVQHPNLVSLGELISEGELWFFTMELVEGHDFLEYVRPADARRAIPASTSAPPPSISSERAIAIAPTVRGAPRSTEAGFDELRLRSALPQIVFALEALHAGGMVHRDIKPANIRVNASGRVVLLDFGLVAEFTSSHSLTGVQMAGTPAYMAPEQAASGPVGPAADWYAVGVLLYEALTGALPFEGTPLAMMMGKQQDGTPPSARAPGMPSDLDTLCAKLLRVDPKARPEGGELLRALGVESGVRGGGGRSQPSSLTEAPPFVGRTEEMARLRKAFVDSRTCPVTVLVEGESGVGKSCLVRNFVETLAHEAGDLVVLAGRCYEREAVPYKAFDGVIDALTRFLLREAAAGAVFVPARAGPLAQVFPVLCRVEGFASAARKRTDALDPLELRSRAFAALRDMLTRLGEKRALVLVIDDLQWADADSLTLLAEVLRPPEAPAMLLVGTARATASGETTLQPSVAAVRDLAKALSGDLRHVVLSRLSEDEARDLASSLLQRTPGPAGGPTANAIAREAEGHPFFIDALVRHAALVGGVATGRLEEALWSSVASLEPTARLMMELVAIAGAPITQDVLAAAAEVAPEAFGRHVARLRIAHLITVTGARATDIAEPYHDRVRSAVLAHLDDATRAERHRALAHALEHTRSQDVEALALHWRGAGDVEQAAKYAVRAAEVVAGALAFDRSAKLYETALELGKHTDAERRGLQEKLADALVNAGRGARAAVAYREAARGATAALTVDLQRRAAEQLLRGGHFDEGIAAIRDVLASIGLSLPRTPLAAVLSFLVRRLWLRVRGLSFKRRDASQVTAEQLTRIDISWSLTLGLVFIDPVRGAAFQARNLLLALRTGEPYRLARAMAAEVGYLGRGGGRTWRRARGLMDRARALAEESGEPQAVGFVFAVSGVALYLNGRYREALDALDRAAEILRERCTGVTWELDMVQMFSANCLAQLGALRRLSREAPRALRDAFDRGDTFASVNLRVGYANLPWLVDDDPDEARAQVHAAMEAWSKQGFHLEHYFELFALTNIDLFEGRAREAYTRVAERWSTLRRSLLPATVQSIGILAWHFRARCALAVAEATGEAALLKVAARDAHAIERERMAWANPLAALLRAGIAATRDDRERAVPLLRAAIAGFDAADMALYAAASRRSLGTLLGGDEGRALVEQAETWMKSETVKNPAKMTAMLAPGFGKPK
jgi:tetratricopeptide (TPR) repeat protein